MHDVIVVGGGPGGILSGYYFQKNDINCLVLEKECIGSSFRKMKSDMVLLSPAVPGVDWTSLTLTHPIWALEGVQRPFPRRDDFIRYLERFVHDTGVAVMEHAPVLSISKDEQGFKVVTQEEELSSRFVVVATGYYGRPKIPEIPGLKGNPAVEHYVDFVNCESYRGDKVLVVGGGNSAAEVTIGLSGISKVTLFTRSPLQFFSETDDPGNIRGRSESSIKELIKLGIVQHICGDEMKFVDGGEVHFNSGRVEKFDKIILATGFLPVLPQTFGVEIEVEEHGVPMITGSGESLSVMGLFFSGSLAMFHSRCRFIHGFRSEVEKVTWAIFDRL